MEFGTLIQERYSVRKFSDKPVTEIEERAILEAARHAPTAVNHQPQRLLVLKTAPSLAKLKECTAYTFGAPLAILVCYDKNEAWVRPFDQQNSGLIDAAIVATHIMLAVHELGLGTTWVGHFDPLKARQAFALPEHIEPVALFPIGHPAPDAEPSPRHAERKTLAETVRYEHF